MIDGHKQFTYKLEPGVARSRSGAEEWFKQQGLLGWELCGQEWGHFIFKREIIEFL